jgi:DNA-binding transcriptional regulator YiaG
MVPKRPSKPAAAKAPELTPDDIRRIREKLGLSHVEAGELLGGGPRAFTKYEGSSINPTASTANVLRMLDADPSALATLTGKTLPPIDSDGSKPFEVTGQHVSVLSERKLVNLMRRLLSAEAHNGELPPPRLSDLVLYAVETEVGSVAVKNIVQSLADAGIRAIVVVDRCAQDTNQDLAAMVKRASSRLSLVTVDHEVPRPTDRVRMSSWSIAPMRASSIRCSSR